MMNKQLQKEILRLARTSPRRRYPFGKNLNDCSYASYEIASKLTKVPGVCFLSMVGCFQGKSHCWVEVWEAGRPGTRRIVDVTADQFANSSDRKCKLNGCSRRIPAIIFAPKADWPEYAS